MRYFKSRSGFVFCILVPKFPGGTTSDLQIMKKHALTGVSLTLHKSEQKKPRSLIDCMVCFYNKWSFKTHMQIWQESVWQRGDWHEFWTNFEEEAIIDTYIRRYHNVSKIKINRECFQDPFSSTLTQNFPIAKSSNFTSILALFHFK